MRAALVTSLGFGHVSALIALAHPDVFVEAIPAEQRTEYLTRARARRVAGARAQLAAMHGGEPVLARRTERRLGSGSTYEVRDREAAILLDPAGKLPGAGRAGWGAGRSLSVGGDLRSGGLPGVTGGPPAPVAGRTACPA